MGSKRSKDGKGEGAANPVMEAPETWCLVLVKRNKMPLYFGEKEKLL